MRAGTFVVTIPVVLVLIAGAGFLALRPGSVEQPIAFNHSKHVQDMGLDCTTCHLYALTGVRATIPNLQVCGMCHVAPLTDSPEEAILVEFVQAQEPIPWQKVYWVEEHVFFSHRRHTAVAGITCETCHSAVGEMTTPVSTRAVKITMDGCVSCHRAEGASVDCIVCHR